MNGLSEKLVIFAIVMFLIWPLSAVAVEQEVIEETDLEEFIQEWGDIQSEAEYLSLSLPETLDVIRTRGWDEFFVKFGNILLCASYCSGTKQGFVDGDLEAAQSNFDKLIGPFCRTDSRMVPASAPNLCPDPDGKYTSFGTTLGNIGQQDALTRSQSRPHPTQQYFYYWGHAGIYCFNTKVMLVKGDDYRARAEHFYDLLITNYPSHDVAEVVGDSVNPTFWCHNPHGWNAYLKAGGYNIFK